jgi:hypothetical protein
MTTLPIRIYMHRVGSNGNEAIRGLFCSLIALSLFAIIATQARAASNIFTISKNGSSYVYTNSNGYNVTDSLYATKLINKAISDASSSGSGTVIIYPGSYQLNASLVPLSNVFLNASGATIYEAAPENLSMSISLMISASPVSNFTVYGGTWDANRSSLSDHRGSANWDYYFFNYMCIAFYGGGSWITVENALVKNCINSGINTYEVSNAYVYNNTVLNCGDNPITFNGNTSGEPGTTNGNWNDTAEYNTVIGSQDVAINTFHADNCTLRYNTVSNASEYPGASHWGIAAENSYDVHIIGNNVTGGVDSIVSTSNKALIEGNNVTCTSETDVGIQEQGVDGNVIQNNIVRNCHNYQSIGDYGSATTNALLINNTVINSNAVWIGATNVTIQGGSIDSPTDGNGCINLDGCLNVRILNITFTGVNGLTNYGSNSSEIFFAYNNFSALSGTKVSLATSTNITYANNIGYGNGPSSPSLYGSSSGWENSNGTDETDAGLWSTMTNANDTLTVNSTIKYSGNYSLRAYDYQRDNGVVVKSSFTDAVSYLNVTFAFRYDAQIPSWSSQPFAMMYDSSELIWGGFGVCGLGMETNGSSNPQLWFWYNNGTATADFYNPAWYPQPNGWYIVNMVCRISATSGSYSVTINGTNYVNITGLNNTAATSIKGLALGVIGYTGYAPVDFFYDDVNVTGPMNYLTVQSSAGGSTNPSVGTYGYVQNAVITATPSIGNSFLYWNVDGSKYPDVSNPVYVPMNANHTIAPVFLVLNQSCTENWSCTSWSSCSGGTQSRTCTDANSCGTTASKPSESQSCGNPGTGGSMGSSGSSSMGRNVSIKPSSNKTLENPQPPSAETQQPFACKENWVCGDWSACQNGQQVRTCTDANGCDTISGLPAVSQSCIVQESEKPASITMITATAAVLIAAILIAAVMVKHKRVAEPNGYGT